MSNLFFSSVIAIVALFLLVVGSSGVSAEYPSKQVLALSNNGYATFNNVQNIPSGSSDRTISVWIKQSARSELFDATILSFGAGYDVCTYQEFSLGINPTGNAFATACGTWIFSHATKIVVGDWSHIAFTYSNAGSFLYVNAIQGPNLGRLLMHTNLVEGFIGMRAVNHAGFFNGYLDNLRIYNIALSATDINNDRIASPKKGLVLHFDMAALGETLIDNINGPNATMNAGASVVILTDAAIPTVQRLSLSSPTDLTIKALITPTTFLPSGSSDRSFSAWIYRTPDPLFSAAYARETVLAFATPNADGSTTTADETILTFGVTNTGFVFLLANGWGAITTSLRTETGRWHHIAASINRTTWILSVDGVSEHFQRNTARMITSTKQVSVGVSYDGGFRFNGFIDELRIYQRALTAEEIVYDKNVKEYGLLEGLVARFDGEVNEDNKLTDSIGRLTLSGLKVDATMISPAGGSSIALPGNGYASFNNVQNIPAGSNDRTISVWIKQSYRSSIDATIISFGAGYQSCYTELALGINRNGNAIVSSCNQFSHFHPLLISVGEWNHLSFTFSNTLQQMNRLYVNAIAQDLGSLSLSTVVGEVFIGMRGMNRAEFFTGFIDSLRIYNRALSQIEISADRIGVAGSVSGLVVNIIDLRSPNANGTLIDPLSWNTATLSPSATIVSSTK